MSIRFYKELKVKGVAAHSRVYLGQLRLEYIIRKPVLEFASRLHVGNLGSETPWDGHMTLFGSGLYWGVEHGRHLAHQITSARSSKKSGKTEFHSRELSLRMFDGCLWWNLWTNEDKRRPKRVKGKKYRRWARRNGSISLNPMEWIFGRLNFFYEDLDQCVGNSISMEEADYPVILTLQKVTRGRVQSKKRTFEQYCVDVDAPRGIPTHYDKSGGWKGDRTFGFAVTIPKDIAESGLRSSEWPIDALNLVKAYILKQRGSTGFREAQVETNG